MKEYEGEKTNKFKAKYFSQEAKERLASGDVRGSNKSASAAQYYKRLANEEHRPQSPSLFGGSSIMGSNRRRRNIFGL